MENPAKKIAKGSNSAGMGIKSKHQKQIIDWLTSIPQDELSDKMLELAKQMNKENHPVEWLKFQFLDKCEEEINNFIEWNEIF